MFAANDDRSRDMAREAEADLKGVPFAKRMISHSYEGIELQALYTEEVFPTAGDPAGLPG